MMHAADKQHFREHGYVVLESLVPANLCAAARDAISEFLRVDAEDPRTWYEPGIQGHGIVPLHHAQAFWDIRQHPDVHAAFADLYGTERLWVSVDRASFKAPARGFADGYRVDPIHWDGDVRRLGRLSVQGLVYLSDTSEAQGGFCCVPELYRNLDAYLAGLTDDTTPRRPNIEGYEIRSVGAPAGSLILWDRRLPHSSGENGGDLPR